MNNYQCFCFHNALCACFPNDVVWDDEVHGNLDGERFFLYLDAVEGECTNITWNVEFAFNKPWEHKFLGVDFWSLREMDSFISDFKFDSWTFIVKFAFYDIDREEFLKLFRKFICKSMRKEDGNDGE